MTSKRDGRRVTRRSALKFGAVAICGAGVVGAGAGAIKRAELVDGTDDETLPQVLEDPRIISAIEKTDIVIRGFDLSAEEKARLPRIDSDVDRLEDAELAILMRSEFPEHERLIDLLNGGTGVAFAGQDASRAFFSTLEDVPESDVEEVRRGGEESSVAGEKLDDSYGITLSPESNQNEVTMLVPRSGSDRMTAARSLVSTDADGDQPRDSRFLEEALAVYARSHIKRVTSG